LHLFETALGVLAMIGDGLERGRQIWLGQSLGWGGNENDTLRAVQSFRFRYNASRFETRPVQWSFHQADLHPTRKTPAIRFS